MALNEAPLPNPEDIRRGLILNRAPVLCDFLETGNVDETLITQVGVNIFNDIQGKYGRRFSQEQTSDTLDMEATKIGMLYIDAGLVASEDLENDPEALIAFGALVEIILYAGFEIGDYADIRLFLPGISQTIINYDRLTGNKFFSNHGREQLEKYGDTTLKFVTNTALKSGIALRLSLTKNIPVQRPETKKVRKPNLNPYKVAFKDDPTILDPDQEDIPVDFRTAFENDPDDALSVPPDLFGEMVDFIRRLPEQTGDDKKEDS